MAVFVLIALLCHVSVRAKQCFELEACNNFTEKDDHLQCMIAKCKPITNESRVRNLNCCTIIYPKTCTFKYYKNYKCQVCNETIEDKCGPFCLSSVMELSTSVRCSSGYRCKKTFDYIPSKRTDYFPGFTVNNWCHKDLSAKMRKKRNSRKRQLMTSFVTMDLFDRNVGVGKNYAQISINDNSNIL